jgi:two-component system CheB/CheR fusion protein
VSRAPIFVWDFDDGIVEWNRGSEELYGYTRAEAIGRRKPELLGLKAHDFEQLQAELLREGSWFGELRHRTKDGRALTVESRMQIETFDGRRLVLESIRDVSERKAWEERQNMLLRELSHRVKNTLTVVQAIAHQTLHTSPSPKDFVERFDGRLAALASVHDRLVQSEWQGADLAALARDHVAPYVSDRPDRIRLEGEPVALPADIATPFALVLHELATNAAKHGSLSVPDGRIELQWHIVAGNDERVLKLAWREQNGPPVTPPARSGLGSALIERTIPHATVQREFRADGLVCTIEVPLPEKGGQ